MFSEEFENRLQKYIYLFELVDGYRFIYSSFPKEESLLILEATLYYDFLKKYPVLRIADKKEQRTGFDIDIVTKEYMYYYGIHYVRGGSYSNEILTTGQEAVLIEEFKTFENAEQKPREYFITILLDEYRGRFAYKEEVDIEISRVMKKKELYTIEKERLAKYKSCIPWIYTFSDHINTLRIQCNNKNGHKDYASMIYKEIIKKIKAIYFLVVENFPEILEKQNKGDLIYCRYPEFLFDNIIFRSELGSLVSVCRICDLLIYFGDFILNRIHEYEYDIKSYGYEDDWTFSRRLYYLVNLKSFPF